MTEEPQIIKLPIVFYCKDCEKLVAGIKLQTKYVYRCPICGTKNVSFGTEKSIKSFYHLVESAPQTPVVK